MESHMRGRLQVGSGISLFLALWAAGCCCAALVVGENAAVVLCYAAILPAALMLISYAMPSSAGQGATWDSIDGNSPEVRVCLLSVAVCTIACTCSLAATEKSADAAWLFLAGTLLLLVVRVSYLTKIDVTGDAAATVLAWSMGVLRLRPRTSRLVCKWERSPGRLDIDMLQPGDVDWAALIAAQEKKQLQVLLGRTIDIAVSLALLAGGSGLMLLVAALIAAESRGPVLYSQERVGLNGRLFRIYKFRSMRVDAERNGPVWAAQKDPRVTRVGRFIRATRLDELPQLWNVLRGDMALVGPRPERPHFVQQLSQAIEHFDERARIKPGLTGWAQVSYPYGASIADARAKLSFDLYYVMHRNLTFDLAVIAATVRVVFFRVGSR